jgi:hypothetical protein
LGKSNQFTVLSQTGADIELVHRRSNPLRILAKRFITFWGISKPYTCYFPQQEKQKCHSNRKGTNKESLTNNQNKTGVVLRGVLKDTHVGVH